MKTNNYMNPVISMVGLFCYLATGALYAACPASPGTTYNSLRPLATSSKQTRDGGSKKEWQDNGYVSFTEASIIIAYQNDAHNLKSTDYCIYLPSPVPDPDRVQMTSGDWNVHYRKENRVIEFTSRDPGGAVPLLAATVSWKGRVSYPEPLGHAVTLIKVTGDDCLPSGSFCFDSHR